MKKDFVIPVKSYMTMANSLSMAFGGITGMQVTEEHILAHIGELETDNLVESQEVD